MKGSTFERVTDIDLVQEVTGDSGRKVLKDLNFQKHVNKKQKIKITDQSRENLLTQIKSDSEFLRKHCLIDYSVFLLEVDRQKVAAPG